MMFELFQCIVMILIAYAICNDSKELLTFEGKYAAHLNDTFKTLR